MITSGLLIPASCSPGGDPQRPPVIEPALDLVERRQPVLLQHPIGVVEQGVLARAGAELAACLRRQGKALLEALDELVDVRPGLPGPHRRPDAVVADLPAGSAD